MAVVRQTYPVTATQIATHVGEIATLWRYPVKSMLGEEVSSVLVDRLGLDGDRRLAFMDKQTGLVVSAKQPRLWRELLKFTAAVSERLLRSPIRTRV